MKYITTDTHPHIKPNIEFEKEIIIDRETGFYATGYIRFDETELSEQLEKGYIKEVQKKEFTKADMIEFANIILMDNSDDSDTDILNKWIKQR